MNYLTKIPTEWIKTLGRESNVFIIDSGCDIRNVFIKNNIREYKEFSVKNIEHGTHVCGIICSNSYNVFSVNGFAQSCNIYFAGIDMGQSSDYQNIISALEWLLEKKVVPHVLNLSFAYKQDNPQIKDLLLAVSKKGTIICAAYSPALKFPHSYEFIISVGNEKNGDIITNGIFTSTVGNNKFKRLAGSSMSCAFVSSIAAIAKSYDCGMDKNQFLSEISGGAPLQLKIDKNMINRKQINLGK